MQHEWERELEIYSPTGSRAICDPPPLDTDEDYVVYDSQCDLSEHLVGLGFAVEGKPGFYTGNDAGKFVSYRKGDLNLIVTQEREFYELFVSATELARRFNLTSKADRIALFQVVLYGVDAHNLEVE